MLGLAGETQYLDWQKKLKIVRLDKGQIRVFSKVFMGVDALAAEFCLGENLN